METTRHEVNVIGPDPVGEIVSARLARWLSARRLGGALAVSDRPRAIDRYIDYFEGRARPGADPGSTEDSRDRHAGVLGGGTAGLAKAARGRERVLFAGDDAPVSTVASQANAASTPGGVRRAGFRPPAAQSPELPAGSSTPRVARTAAGSAVLRVDGLRKHFGAIAAVAGITVEIRAAARSYKRSLFQDVEDSVPDLYGAVRNGYLQRRHRDIERRREELERYSAPAPRSSPPPVSGSER